MNKKKNILIIEDEEDLAELVAQRFEATGYRTVCTRNGLEGLDKLKKLNLI